MVTRLGDIVCSHVCVRQPLPCCKHTCCRLTDGAPPDGVKLEWRQPALKVWVHDDGADLLVQRKGDQGDAITHHQLIVVDVRWPHLMRLASEVSAPAAAAAPDSSAEISWLTGACAVVLLRYPWSTFKCCSCPGMHLQPPDAATPAADEQERAAQLLRLASARSVAVFETKQAGTWHHLPTATKCIPGVPGTLRYKSSTQPDSCKTSGRLCRFEQDAIVKIFRDSPSQEQTVEGTSCMHISTQTHCRIAYASDSGGSSSELWDLTGQ
jgi:hypothetical protein